MTATTITIPNQPISNRTGRVAALVLVTAALAATAVGVRGLGDEPTPAVSAAVSPVPAIHPAEQAFLDRTSNRNAHRAATTNTAIHPAEQAFLDRTSNRNAHRATASRPAVGTCEPGVPC